VEQERKVALRLHSVTKREREINFVLYLEKKTREKHGKLTI
jgi:hypothetical protein